jgi:hypothetical protein
LWESYQTADGGTDFATGTGAIFGAESLSVERKLNIEYESRFIEICEK